MEEKTVLHPHIQQNGDPVELIDGIICVETKTEEAVNTKYRTPEPAPGETDIVTVEKPGKDSETEEEKKEDPGRVWFLLGTLFIVAAFGLILYNRAEAKRADKVAETISQSIEKMLTGSKQPVYDSVNDFLRVHAQDEENLTYPVYLLDPDAKMLMQEVDGIPCIALLEIPILGLELPIGKEWDYEKLKSVPCCYHGNLYSNDFVICGHNYARHFGNLKLLEPGDEVYATDMQGTVFPFTVTEVEIRSPRDINGMIYGKDWDLTLYTCTPNGRNRVTVRCVRTTG